MVNFMLYIFHHHKNKNKKTNILSIIHIKKLSLPYWREAQKEKTTTPTLQIEANWQKNRVHQPKLV